MKNIIKKHLKKQTGDTIVEVMLAIIVIGGTLGGAFAIANRSTKTTQANYERYQAQVIANNQAELLKKYMGVSGKISHNSFDNVPPYNKCISDSGDAKTAADCKIDGLYTITLTCTDVSCASNYHNYKIRVEWDSLNGGKDNVELFYGV